MTKSCNLMSRLAILVVLIASACGPGKLAESPQEPNPTQADASPTPKPTRTRIPTSTPEPISTPEPTLAFTSTLPAETTPLITATLATTATLPTVPPVQATSPAASILDKCEYVSQNVADNTQVTPGETLDIIWTVKNTGKTEWGTDYSLRFFVGPKPPKILYNFPNKVPPGKTLDLVVSLVTPSSPGTYNSWWKLANSKNQNFCDVNFIFIVTNTPVTNTPEP